MKNFKDKGNIVEQMVDGIRGKKAKTRLKKKRICAKDLP